jgi:XapX domain-containing protein
MKPYLASLAVGILVGLIYGAINIRSPAPPVIALVGLLGMLAGEQVAPLVRSAWAREHWAVSWVHQVRPHMFGRLPAGRLAEYRPRDIPAPEGPKPDRR